MRQTSKVIATSCAAVLVGLATVSGQGPAPPAAAPGPAPSAPQPKAFQRLFAPPPAKVDPGLRPQLDGARQKLKDVLSGSARRFTCGMPILTPNPSIDPTFVVPPDPRVKFSMPTLKPPCD